MATPVSGSRHEPTAKDSRDPAPLRRSETDCLHAGAMGGDIRRGLWVGEVAGVMPPQTDQGRGGLLSGPAPNSQADPLRTFTRQVTLVAK